jgi:hypothetical protein
MRKFVLAATACAAPIALAHPALAAPGDPVKVSDSVTIDPIIDARLRYESVDQPATDADALTLRLRAGADVNIGSGFSLLAEGEGTLALVDNYNAFPFPIADSQRRTAYSVVADPMNVELNRLQIQYKSKPLTVTIGRQRINLDDQRWVGAVGWRQNEQTFDAARAEARIGPVSLDAAYAISQRTIFGYEGGPRNSYHGNFMLLGAGAKLGPVNLKAFAYLLDYDLAEQGGTQAIALADTKTFGVRATTSLPLSKALKLNLAASYASQSDYKQNPVDYSAEYIALEGGLAFKQLGVMAGWELKGADNGRAVQTPMATMHKFDGWADLFLVTPATGLQDLYVGATFKLDMVKAVPGLNAAVTWHEFTSDVGDIKFGNEWDASIGFKLGRVNLLAKYADFDAKAPGFVDTRKFWLQAEIAY